MRLSKLRGWLVFAFFTALSVALIALPQLKLELPVYFADLLRGPFDPVRDTLDDRVLFEVTIAVMYTIVSYGLGLLSAVIAYRIYRLTARCTPDEESKNMDEWHSLMKRWRDLGPIDSPHKTGTYKWIKRRLRRWEVALGSSRSRELQQELQRAASEAADEAAEKQ